MIHKLKILPQEFAKMTIEEQAFIIACIRKKVKDEDREIKKIKRKNRR